MGNAKIVRTPEGHELKPVILVVEERDVQGPRKLRMLYDHEKIDVTNDLHVLIVWTNVKDVLGEMRLADVITDLDEREYGRKGMEDLEDRLARADAKGTSSHLHDSRDEQLQFNRAGIEDMSLTVEEIADYYVLRRGKGKRPAGRKPDAG